MMTRLITTAFAVSMSLALCSGQSGGADVLFAQEFHEPLPLGGDAGANDVRVIAVDRENGVWAGTRIGLFRRPMGARQWQAVTPAADVGPVFALMPDDVGRVWIGAWNGLHVIRESRSEPVSGITAPIAALCSTRKGLLAIGPDGLWRQEGDAWKRHPLPASRATRGAVADARDGVWMATGYGLVHQDSAGARLFVGEREILGPYLRGLAWDSAGRLWAGGLGGITVFNRVERVAAFTPANGLPTIDVQSVDRGPDGRMWVGTPIGVARYDGRSWSLRHSRRWLLADDVRDVAFDTTGNAWVATAGGVSVVRQRQMTLAEKSEHYLGACYARHIREPGLVEKCRLRTPGDLSTWEPYDDDNDGQYTGMYLAMESYRYAVTRDPTAQANARRAFHALRFLQTVTGTSGFFARTVVPASWKTMADPNRRFTEPEWAAERVEDPRSKRVEQRWRPSSDGRWLWKGDTSSDEVTGHFYGYYHFHKLAATEADRAEVREHVRRIMDYIIAGGYVLKDIDGAHTRWAVWSPEKLNHDPDWVIDRNVNSVELLSFLKLARHVTGDAKYQSEYQRLIRDHGYAEHARRAKNTHPSTRTHIDDELLGLAYPALLELETDPRLLRIYRQGLEGWHAAHEADRNPWFDFTYETLQGKNRFSAARVDSALEVLRDAPLDLIRWTVDNSRREDVRRVRLPEQEHVQTDRVLPLSERGIFRHDGNPFIAVQGDGGVTEGDGVSWLLPYWMGRYHGFISPPAAK